MKTKTIVAMALMGAMAAQAGKPGNEPPPEPEWDGVLHCTTEKISHTQYETKQRIGFGFDLEISETEITLDAGFVPLTMPRVEETRNIIVMNYIGDIDDLRLSLVTGKFSGEINGSYTEGTCTKELQI